MDDMINKIERAVIAHLQDAGKRAGLEITEFEVGKDLSSSIAKSALAGVTTEKIGFEYVISYYELQPVISVYVAVKGVQSKVRHEGIYPMIVAAASLAGKNLGLNIEPFEPAAPMTEVFPPSADSLGLRVYRIDFKTAFEFVVPDDETLEKLLTTVNEYHYRDHELGMQVIYLPNDLVIEKETDNASNS
jgi:hypothetical protein